MHSSPHSLGVGPLLQGLRASALFELAGRLDFEDERCPSVRALVLRALLAAALRVDSGGQGGL